MASNASNMRATRIVSTTENPTESHSLELCLFLDYATRVCDFKGVDVSGAAFLHTNVLSRNPVQQYFRQLSLSPVAVFLMIVLPVLLETKAA